MPISATDLPAFVDFEVTYQEGQRSIVWSIEAGELETPVAAFMKLADSHPDAFLLESVEGGSARGRYSVIGMRPDLVWRCREGKAEISRQAWSDARSFVAEDNLPLESLRALIADTAMMVPPQLPPMVGGLFGYLGYDMVRQMERLPAQAKDGLGLPDAILLRPTLFVIFDNVRDELIIAAAVRPQQGDAKVAYDDAQASLASVRAALARPRPAPRPPVVHPPQPEPESNMVKGRFLDMVARVKDYIAAGDAFQVVCSQRFSAPFVLPPLELYRALRRINPAPFLFFFDFGTFAIAGSSPEVLVRLRDGIVTIRPLAGTRPRGIDHEEDQRLAAELLADPKERAEHLMLLDLGRNDVSRVTLPGTVRVTQSFAIERFSHVMHISSNVQGRLRDGLGALDALMAGFPAGTLSGAPKIRAMEIIEELEPTRRGIYGGCIGYFAANGSMDTCIALRTAVVKDGVMYVQAGGGIVADSVPEAEYEETGHKARALFRAAEEAMRAAAAR